MKTWITALAALLVISSTATLAHPSDRLAEPLRVKDVGRLVPAVLGQDVVILLPAYLGTGFHWQVNPELGYRVVGPISTIDDPDHHGHDVSAIRLRFFQAGPTNVRIDNFPGGHGGGAASSSLRYRFLVR